MAGRGPNFSLADINVIPFVARLDYLTLLDVWIKGRPLVAAWWQSAKARPSFAAAVAQLLSENQIKAMANSGSRIKSEIAAKHVEIATGRNQP